MTAQRDLWQIAVTNPDTGSEMRLEQLIESQEEAEEIAAIFLRAEPGSQAKAVPAAK